jgi:hypothetical protein
VDRPGVGDAHVLKRAESGSFNRAATSAICKFTIRALQKCIRRQVRPHSLKARVIFNVAPTELDIYPTTSWDEDALVQPQSRAAYARLLKQGWRDALREMHGEGRVYTFWHYLRNRWERDAGLRLDHILLSPDLAPRLKAAGVDRAVRGRLGARDHAPVWIELTRSPLRRSRPGWCTQTGSCPSAGLKWNQAAR